MEVALGVPKYGILNIYSFFCSLSELESYPLFFVHVIFQYSQFVISCYLLECDLEGDVKLINFLARCAIIGNFDQKLHLLILENIID